MSTTNNLIDLDGADHLKDSPTPRYFGREKSRTRSDKAFSGAVVVAALSSLLILVAILFYLATSSWPALQKEGF